MGAGFYLSALEKSCLSPLAVIRGLSAPLNSSMTFAVIELNCAVQRTSPERLTIPPVSDLIPREQGRVPSQ